MTKKTFLESKKIMGKKLDSEWVFLNLENGVYYGLNETGSLIWDELKSQKDFLAVVEKLETVFQVDRPTAEKDLRQFLKKLKEEGLAKIEAFVP